MEEHSLWHLIISHMGPRGQLIILLLIERSPCCAPSSSHAQPPSASSSELSDVLFVLRIFHKLTPCSSCTHCVHPKNRHTAFMISRDWSSSEFMCFHMPECYISQLICSNKCKFISRKDGTRRSVPPARWPTTALTDKLLILSLLLKQHIDFMTCHQRWSFDFLKLRFNLACGHVCFQNKMLVVMDTCCRACSSPLKARTARVFAVSRKVL